MLVDWVRSMFSALSLEIEILIFIFTIVLYQIVFGWILAGRKANKDSARAYTSACPKKGHQDNGAAGKSGSFSREALLMARITSIGSPGKEDTRIRKGVELPTAIRVPSSATETSTLEVSDARSRKPRGTSRIMAALRGEKAVLLEECKDLPAMPPPQPAANSVINHADADIPPPPPPPADDFLDSARMSPEAPDVRDICDHNDGVELATWPLQRGDVCSGKCAQAKPWHERGEDKQGRNHKFARHWPQNSGWSHALYKRSTQVKAWSWTTWWQKKGDWTDWMPTTSKVDTVEFDTSNAWSNWKGLWHAKPDSSRGHDLACARDTLKQPSPDHSTDRALLHWRQWDDSTELPPNSLDATPEGSSCALATTCEQTYSPSSNQPLTPDSGPLDSMPKWRASRAARRREGTNPQGSEDSFEEAGLQQCEHSRGQDVSETSENQHVWARRIQELVEAVSDGDAERKHESPPAAGEGSRNNFEMESSRDVRQRVSDSDGNQVPMPADDPWFHWARNRAPLEKPTHSECNMPTVTLSQPPDGCKASTQHASPAASQSNKHKKAKQAQTISRPRSVRRPIGPKIGPDALQSETRVLLATPRARNDRTDEEKVKSNSGDMDWQPSAGRDIATSCDGHDKTSVVMNKQGSRAKPNAAPAAGASVWNRPSILGARLM